MCMLLLYAILGAFMETKRPIVGTEMSVTILVGIGLSFIIQNVTTD